MLTNTQKIFVFGATATSTLPTMCREQYLYLTLNEATLWALLKNTKLPKKKFRLHHNSYSQQKLLCGLHRRPTLTTARGGKHKPLYGGHRCVLVHPHFPSITSDPSGLLISCRARKWEGGQPGRSGDVTAGNEWRDCCRGWRRGKHSKWVSRRWVKRNECWRIPGLWLLLITLWEEVLPVMRAERANLVIYLQMHLILWAVRDHITDWSYIGTQDGQKLYKQSAIFMNREDLHSRPPSKKIYSLCWQAVWLHICKVTLWHKW